MTSRSNSWKSELSAEVSASQPISAPGPCSDPLPCPDCGASLPAAGDPGPVCDDERRLDYRLVELQPEIERFDDDLAAWLETPDGRFARFVAEQGR